MPDTIDRSQPPPKYFTPSGFQNATNGPPNTYAAIGSNHTRAHFDSRGWIDQIGEPTSSTGIPGSAMVPYDPWDPNNPRAANQPPPVIQPPPPVVTPPPPTTEPPVTTTPPGTPPPGTPPPYIPPPTVPIDVGNTLDFANGISVRLYLHDTRSGLPAMGRALHITGETGAFHFGDAGNLEVIVKVLDGRGVNGHFWIFAAGLTDVGCELVATKGAQTKRYTNAQGTAFLPIQDTSAFAA